MKNLTKKAETSSLISSLIFWTVMLVVSIAEYNSLGFNLNPIMIVFWAGSMLAVTQSLFCIGLPAGASKHRAKWFIPKKGNNISKMQLKKHRKQASIIAIIWIVFLICEWAAIHLNFVDHRIIIVGIIILRIADRMFVMIWCPFGAIMKNRCCSDCRIYGWDQLMLNSPMIFYITTPFVAILIVLATVTFIEWEISHWKHPERFSSTTNEGITCKHCNGVCGRCKKIWRASLFTWLFFFIIVQKTSINDGYFSFHKLYSIFFFS